MTRSGVPFDLLTVRASDHDAAVLSTDKEFGRRPDLSASVRARPLAGRGSRSVWAWRRVAVLL
jgi:hypothetical protein